VRFAVTTSVGALSGNVIDVNLADLGFTGDVVVRDLWSQTDLGTFSGTLSSAVAGHGARLLLITERSLTPPAFTSIQVNPAGSVEIFWDSVPSRTYRVSYTDDLVGNLWIPLTNFTAVSTSSPFTDFSAGNATVRFYRVEQL